MRALIIEDNDDLVTLWRVVLERRACDVVVARSASVAERELTAGGPFDIILSDLHLGDAASAGLLDYARIKHPRAVIVLVTGTQIYTRGELHAVVPAADWVLRKPVPIADLEAVIDYLQRGPSVVSGGGVAVAERAAG